MQPSRAGLSVVIGGRARTPGRAPHLRATDAVALQLASRVTSQPASRSTVRPMGADAALRGQSQARIHATQAPGSRRRRFSPLLREAIRRHHALLPLPLVIAAVLLAGARSLTGWAIGAALVAAGIALRLAARAALGRDRARLVTWGAYAWLRHPHDLGTALAWIGLAVSAGVTALLPMLVATLAVLFGLAARAEEGELEARFGEDYARWRRRTPAWIPRRPVATLAAAMDGAAAWSAERGALAGFATLLVAVTLGTLAR